MSKSKPSALDKRLGYDEPLKVGGWGIKNKSIPFSLFEKG